MAQQVLRRGARVLRDLRSCHNLHHELDKSQALAQGRQSVHRHLPASFGEELPPIRRRPFSEMCARLREMREEGVLQSGPAEPLRPNSSPQGASAQRLHLWADARLDVNYPELRAQLGDEGLALRIHVIEYACQTLEWLRANRDCCIDAIALQRLPGNVRTRDLVAAVRARRDLRAIPLFICDSSYCSQSSRELYGAGANGYLCGRVATRQLGAALLRTHRRSKAPLALRA